MCFCDLLLPFSLLLLRRCKAHLLFWFYLWGVLDADHTDNIEITFNFIPSFGHGVDFSVGKNRIVLKDSKAKLSIVSLIEVRKSKLILQTLPLLLMNRNRNRRCLLFRRHFFFSELNWKILLVDDLCSHIQFWMASQGERIHLLTTWLLMKSFPCLEIWGLLQTDRNKILKMCSRSISVTSIESFTPCSTKMFLCVFTQIKL